jgi:hypothetical protein
VQSFACNGVDVDVDDEEILGEGRTGRHEISVGVEDEGRAVEDEFVLAADEVDVAERHHVVRGARSEHPAAELVDAQSVRRSVDVDDQLGSRPRLPLGRARRIPDVLADADADARAGDHEDGGFVAAPEVSILVEDAVVR